MNEVGMAQYSDAPTQKRPVEPVMSGARRQIDHRQEQVDHDVDDQVDDKWPVIEQTFLIRHDLNLRSLGSREPDLPFTPSGNSRTAKVLTEYFGAGDHFLNPLCRPI